MVIDVTVANNDQVIVKDIEVPLETHTVALEAIPYFTEGFMKAPLNAIPTILPVL